MPRLSKHLNSLAQYVNVWPIWSSDEPLFNPDVTYEPVLELLANTGLRAFQRCNMNISDVAVAHGEDLIRAGKRQAYKDGRDTRKFAETP